MKINNIHRDKFVRVRNRFYYSLSRGLYLAFDEEGYYIGIEAFYNPSVKIENRASELLNKLISLDYIEI